MNEAHISYFLTIYEMGYSIVAWELLKGENDVCGLINVLMAAAARSHKENGL